MEGTVGTMVGGRYRLIDVIGQGGMGRVWRGHDTVLDRTVAVKEITLSPGLSVDELQQMTARMLREAKATARLRHPGIITVHDVVGERNMPWIVMEFVPGRSLGAELKAQARMGWEQVADIGIAVADAISHAHGEGVVHRDLKPDNILLSGRRVILTDFGIAWVADSTTRLTSLGTAIGTPAYMSPEQIEVGADPGPASDVWSLGVTLYAAAEGRLPFSASTLTGLYGAILTQPPQPAQHSGPLSGVLARLLEKNPRARPDGTTALRLLSDLRTASAVRPAASIPAVPAAPAMPATPPRPVTPGPVARPAKQAAPRIRPAANRTTFRFGYSASGARRTSQNSTDEELFITAQKLSVIISHGVCRARIDVPWANVAGLFVSAKKEYTGGNRAGLPVLVRLYDGSPPPTITWLAGRPTEATRRLFGRRHCIEGCYTLTNLKAINTIALEIWAAMESSGVGELYWDFDD